MAKNRLIPILIMASTLILSYPTMGVSDNAPLAQTNSSMLLGEVKQMGNGVIWSWVINDSKGNPSSLGITFTETALSGLPENLPPDDPFPTVEYELSLPKKAKVPPFMHIVVNWNAKGHIPPGIYDVPHFDFHFYIIAKGERYKITARGEDIGKSNKKMPVPYVPPGYILPEGTQEPRMGSHWVDTGSPEFNKKPFTMTFIYGSYNGELTFLEPMAAMAFLETKPNITEKIKLPAAYKRHGFYPTAYHVEYDPVRKEYSVSLEGLTLR